MVPLPLVFHANVMVMLILAIAKLENVNVSTIPLEMSVRWVEKVVSYSKCHQQCEKYEFMAFHFLSMFECQRNKKKAEVLFSVLFCF